ncbi:4-hydroxyphenylpyruvate dioxygenase-like protein isoform X2 [Portunus trituberculatus]|uniref:4-hydroxyphenylpyruvate dioxygenase-like protein isoform X2 n=1 Tax=Portunus trituberculatus TaxID=210409 RepID=UPI001E1CE46C|nr:4-hydroxyphenylpyruvate dioxygenase-like protein isoform X2 [Portunus trituberculatus]
MLETILCNNLGMCSALHHVEICVGEENDLLNTLIKSFSFTLIARHLTPLSTKWALKHGSAVFVITKRKKDKKHLNNVTDDVSGNFDKGKKLVNGQTNLSSESPLIVSNDLFNDLEHWTVFCCQDQTSHAIDSVFNVALVVRDVDEVTKRVETQGGRVLRKPTILKDSHGQVKYSIVTSCLGNVVHTLIDKQNYSGEFLPGFQSFQIDNNKSCSLNSKSDGGEHTTVNGLQQQPVTNYSNICLNDNLNGEPLFTHFDHIALACESGKSEGLIDWYQHCFGMKRFAANRADTSKEGFVLAENIGMRIKAMEYWRCAEVGLTVPSASEEDSSLKIVLAEPLVGYDKSQINTFLYNHNGPGVQHIALHTPNMVSSVKRTSQQGVTFRKAPPAYYEEGIRLEDIKAAGHGNEIDLFQELGILLDIEDDVFCDKQDCQGEKKYLLQVFTTPIFQEDTFFMEVIHRKGAVGFGAGNIRALAQSIICDKQQKKARLAQSIIHNQQ